MALKVLKNVQVLIECYMLNTGDLYMTETAAWIQQFTNLQSVHSFVTTDKEKGST